MQIQIAFTGFPGAVAPPSEAHRQIASLAARDRFVKLAGLNRTYDPDLV
jgi:hypothetical protein